VTGRDADEQRATDMRVSATAAQHGFKILRVAEADMRHLMRMIELAWEKRMMTAGWVLVSRQWNTGAHRVPAVIVCSAGQQFEEDGPE
jgi:hypothetical protein